MIYIIINALPILTATLTSLVIGAIWYRRMPTLTTGIVMFTALAWLAAILAGALILAPPRGGVWTMTIGSAVVIWVGFILPALTYTYRQRDMPWRMIGSDAGFWLVAMIAQATIMRAIGLTPPPM